MTFAQFKTAYKGGYSRRAAETIPGFYRKGQAMYGNCDNMEVADWLYQPLNGVYTVYLKNPDNSHAATADNSSKEAKA